ncbi:hypothetical protein [Jiella marina]|uniref:hypothetical protein n=1 Tax=Jiella sp. LLJ827 TaxID=2917712 RepID=UPI002100BFE1|nr:hypothetical protein [Jiella sp. LLJ827]MCQ0990462.1 hypothetical protein [Jiella sp. LLJ827]
MRVDPETSIVGREPSQPGESLARLISDYDGGGCFAALSTAEADSGRMRITALAASDGRLTDFADHLRLPADQASPDTPRLSAERVGEAQCRVLSFLANAPGYPAYSLRLRLARRLVESGTHLLGRVEGIATGDTLDVLLVDDEGLVQSISAFIERSGEKAQFAVPVTVSGETVETAQIVLALALPDPLIHGNLAEGMPAERFFAALAEAQAASGIEAEFALDYFILQAR